MQLGLVIAWSHQRHPARNLVQITATAPVSAQQITPPAFDAAAPDAGVCVRGSRQFARMAGMGEVRRVAEQVARANNVEISRIDRENAPGERFTAFVTFCGGAADAARAARQF